MKNYYLHLHQDDFVNALSEGSKNKSWITGVIDLYDNANEDFPMATPSYTNYSVTKSPGYGTNLLGDDTWTGLDYELGSTSTPTSTGFVKDGRYIDESGRIDILDYKLELGDHDGLADIVPVLTVYTTDDPTNAEWPDGWAIKENIAENRPIVLFGSDRYVKFQLDFTTDIPDIGSLELDLYIRINISAPVQTPFYETTRRVLNKFPEWMDIREYSATPIDLNENIIATPQSVGAQLINAVAGEWLNELEKDLTYTNLQRYITTADLNQVAWIYYASDVPDYVYRVEGNGTELAHVNDLREFYHQSDTENVFWWDISKKIVYVRQEYDTLTINGEEYNLSPQQVWNWFDEFGLQLDLPRHHLETNEIYRHRILDVYRNRPGVGIEAFKLALRRELNLWLADGATPYSDYLGATPEILEIEDLERDTDYFDYDGMPTDKMVKLVEDLAEQYPTTWGFFRWNNAYWDIGGVAERADDYGQGYDVLPYRYDASPNLPDEKIQSGVGDGNDLYIFRPDAITGPREFNATLKMRGRYLTERTVYPEVVVEGFVYGKADRTIFNNPTIEPWITVRIIDSSGDTYYTEHQATLTSDVDVDTPESTSDSDYIFTLFGEGMTSPDLTWFDEDGNEYSTDGATPFTFDIASLATVEVHFGRYQTGDSPGWYDYPTEDVDLWASDDEDDVINAADATPTAITIDPSAEPLIMLRSHETASSVGDWYSPKEPFKIVLNGKLPETAWQNIVEDVPDILWDNYLENPPNKTYIIELTTKNVSVTGGDFTESSTPVFVIAEDEEFGGWTVDVDGNPLFLDASYIFVNGTNAWNDSGILEFDASSTTEFEWYTGESATPNYPYAVPYWDLFEATANSTMNGVVDENGPWRNGVPPTPGNSNFNFTVAEVTRADFGIPDGSTYVPTWMGVEVDNDRVMAWLDSNVINPVNDHDSINITYPTDAILERFDEDTGAFYFDPFIVRVRLRPGISPQWYPSIHSGYLYDRDDEYYLYANHATETATENNFILQDVARQGAPIIVKTDQADPYSYRQVAFHMATPLNDGATVDSLSLVNTQTVWGTGTNKLYVAYENIYDIEVTRLDTNESVAADIYSTTNEIETIDITNQDVQYEISYKVMYSFYADNEYIANDNTQRTRLTFASPGIPSSATPAKVTYETSKFDPATPIDIPLNTFYTTIDEGYIFISHNEYTLNKVEVRLSPSKLIADGQDYLLVSLRSLDEYENPKPNQSFHLETTFGNFDNSAASPGTTLDLITDRDGFAVATLTSWPSTTSLEGTITITGGVSASIDFQIDVMEQGKYRLVAMPTSDSIIANGEAFVAVYGRLETDEYQPVSNAPIYYRKGRSMYDIFTRAYDDTYVGHVNATPTWPDEGMVYTDEDGRFIIGPFQTATPGEPGYWFLSAESWKDATPPSTPGYDTVGDVVFWYEYPDIAYGINEANELPIQPTQYATPWIEILESATINSFPSTYDDATPHTDATPSSINWEPPVWYAIQKYRQYQSGILGTDRGVVDYNKVSDRHPDHRDY